MKICYFSRSKANYWSSNGYNDELTHTRIVDPTHNEYERKFGRLTEPLILSIRSLTTL
jgi:hypothetical protein